MSKDTITPSETPQAQAEWSKACAMAVDFIGRVNAGADLATELASAFRSQLKEQSELRSALAASEAGRRRLIEKWRAEAKEWWTEDFRLENEDGIRKHYDRRDLRYTVNKCADELGALGEAAKGAGKGHRDEC